MTNDNTSTEANTVPPLEGLRTMADSNLFKSLKTDPETLHTTHETLYGTPDDPGTQCVASPTNVEGVTPGRIVAYWPTDYEKEHGAMPTPGATKYLPAMITCIWSASGTSQVPCVNLQVSEYGGQDVFPKSSVVYSHVPTKGRWGWIPKA